jgi:hypothetical protein
MFEEPGLVCCGVRVGSATRVFRTRWHGKSDLTLHSSPGDLPQLLFVLPTQHSIRIQQYIVEFRESEGKIVLEPHPPNIHHMPYCRAVSIKWKRHQVNAHSFQL